MSTADRTIKIIKREHRKTLANAGVEVPLKTDTQTRREILKTITTWVEHQRKAKKEFRRRSIFRNEPSV